MLRCLKLPGTNFGRRICTHIPALTLQVGSLVAANGFCKLIASHLKGGDVIQLIGKVGTGKTSMARFMIRSMMNNDEEVVQSPTFSLALTYQCASCPRII